jgi:hypothetical protein
VRAGGWCADQRSGTGGQVAQARAQLAAAQVLADRPYRNLDHLVAPARAHQVRSHRVEVVDRRLDEDDLRAALAHASRLAPESAP